MRRRLLGALLLCALAAVSSSTPARAMDRIQWWYGMEPPSSWINQMERWIRLGNGQHLWDTFGRPATTGVYTNITAAPATGLYVTVAPSNANQIGSVYVAGVDDSATFGGPTGALLADPTQIMLQGSLYSISSNIGPLGVPGSNSQYDIIECTVSIVDNNSQTVYYLSATGVVSSGSANRDRSDQVSCIAKSGTPGSSPTVPSPDSGYVDVANVLVPSGTVTITGGMITAATPFTGFAQSGQAATFSAVTNTGAIANTGHVNQAAACGGSACRHALTSGAYTWTFGTAFTSTPVCVATSETATGTLHVTPSTTSCIVTSSSGTDTSTVDIVVVGNPN